MSTLRLEIVTVERVVYQDDIAMVIAPGIEGQMGLLPHHAPLITALTEGELIVHKDGEEDRHIAIGGGFLEVSGNTVTILADTAEHAEEIDLERAEMARRRAEQLLREKRLDAQDFARAEVALRRSLARLKVGRRQRRTGPARPSGGSGDGG